MTAENTICTLCPGRVCANQGTGRLVNDTTPQHPFDLEKIRFDPTPIEECDLKGPMEIDDSVSEILLGS